MTSLTLRKTRIVSLLHDNAEQQNIALGLAMDWVNDFGDESQKEAVTKCCAKYRNLLKINKLDIILIEKNRNNLLLLLEEIESSLSGKMPSQQVGNVLVELQNIRKSYQKNSFTLHDLSLDFRQGEITGIVGANANGKSTLVKIIVGEHLQDGGTLRFPHWQGADKSFSWQRIKQKIAYLPQELTPWSGSLRENLTFEATAHGIFGKSNTIAVDYIIERLSLSDYVNATWQELSGGYKLRYALAKALVWQPELLILDEPLANLDINAQLVVLADLKAMAASEKYPVGVILTSQHIHEVELVADQIIVLDKGVLKYAGVPNTFQNATQEHIFEFHSDLTINELKDKLHIFPIQTIKQKGAYFILQVPNSVSAAQFLSHAAAQDIRLSYFRDISHSVKQLFL
jgi:ABC-2 type transport system ATP-binding protein